jgi:hypothetical protein
VREGDTPRQAREKTTTTTYGAAALSAGRAVVPLPPELLELGLFLDEVSFALFRRHLIFPWPGRRGWKTRRG